jgi:predicted RND superfamily exporter protein
MLKFVYDRFILTYPKTVLLAILLLVAVLGYEARNLEMNVTAAPTFWLSPTSPTKISLPTRCWLTWPAFVMN